MYAEPRQWRQYGTMDAEGITLHITRVMTGEVIDILHFPTIRKYLKYLREENPHLDFKSEKVNYYNVFWVIHYTEKDY